MPPSPPKRRPLTAAESKSEYRARLRAGGRQTLSIAVAADIAEKLKVMAYEGRVSVGAAVDACVKSAEASERRIRWRSKAASEGRQVVTIPLAANAVALLRRLAKEDGVSKEIVITAALTLVANKRLLRQVREWAAEREAKASAEQAK